MWLVGDEERRGKWASVNMGMPHPVVDVSHMDMNLCGGSLSPAPSKREGE